jgi:hypothetical protein
MIDWQVKVLELKQTADELELWASKSKGRQRTVLGRIADDLRQFAAQINRELVPPDEQEAVDVPDWLSAIIEPSLDTTEIEYEEGEEDYYEADEEEWYEDDDEPYE